MLQFFNNFPFLEKKPQKVALLNMKKQKYKDVASLEEIKEAFEAIDNFVRFYKRLIARGILRLKFKFNIIYDQTIGLCGFFMEDMVSELITSFFVHENNKGRHWYKDNPNTDTFEKSVYSAFDSYISNFVKTNLQKHNNTLALIDNMDLSQNSSCEIDEFIDQCIDILGEVGANDDEVLVFNEMANGIQKPSDIAKQLDVDVDVVYQIKKRLMPRISILRTRLNDN